MKKLIIAVSFFVITSVFMGGIGHAKVIKLRLAHYFSPGYAYAVGYDKFAKEVEKRTNGRVKITIYPAGQLVSAKGSFDAVSTGAIEIGHVTDAYFEGKVPLVGIVWLPFLFDDLRVMRSAVDKILPIIQREEFDPVGIKIIAACHAGWVTFGSNVKTPRLPEDLKGQKIRASAWSTSKLVKATGAAPVGGIPSGELYMAMQRGVVDGWAIPWASSGARKLHEVTKYGLVAPMQCSMGYTCMNMKAWKSLPADIQNIIQNTAREIIELEEWFLITPAASADGIKKAEAAGAKVHYITSQEIEAWRELSRPIYEEWLQKLPKKKRPIAKEMIDICIGK